MPPAPSVRISTFRPGRRPGWVDGSWASAALVTSMWSTAVFDPALPLRRIIATGSPVPPAPWSTHAPIGWKPNPRLESRCGQLLLGMRGDQGGIQIDRSAAPATVILWSGASVPANRQTRARTAARAALIAANARGASAARVSINLDTVGIGCHLTEHLRART